MRPKLIAVITAALLLIAASPAAATTTFTVHFTTNPQPDIIPVSCSASGNAISIAGTGNGVFHITINKTGSWVTGTFEGQGTVTTGVAVLVGTPPHPVFTPTGPVYTGHIQEWFGDENNLQNGVEHATFNFNGTDAAGNSVGIHAAFQVTMNANGDTTVSNFTVNCR